MSHGAIGGPQGMPQYQRALMLRNGHGPGVQGGDGPGVSPQAPVPGRVADRERSVRDGGAPSPIAATGGVAALATTGEPLTREKLAALAEAGVPQANVGASALGGVPYDFDTMVETIYWQGPGPGSPADARTIAKAAFDSGADASFAARMWRDVYHAVGPATAHDAAIVTTAALTVGASPSEAVATFRSHYYGTSLSASGAAKAAANELLFGYGGTAPSWPSYPTYPTYPTYPSYPTRPTWPTGPGDDYGYMPDHGYMPDYGYVPEPGPDSGSGDDYGYMPDYGYIPDSGSGDDDDYGYGLESYDSYGSSTRTGNGY